MPGLMPWFRRRSLPPRAPRARLALDAGTAPIYAVGDVHGCLEQLLLLERRIADDAAAHGFTGPKRIVMLGDYVDRGPESAAVLDHLAAPADDGFERTCLAGNHEVAFLDFLDGRIGLDAWLGFGADTTIRSYCGAQPGPSARRAPLPDAAEFRAAVPAHHIAFLRALPVLVDAGSVLMVHAGLRPGLPADAHSDDDLVWTRPESGLDDLPKWVIHGHTPVARVTRNGRAINIDTGAFYSGRLSAVRIWKNKLKVLSSLG